MSTERARLYLLLAVSAVLFSAGIRQYDLWSPDEPRFAQAAREMIQRGDYLAPHVNAQPYMEKPPLLFWLMALCSAPFGDVNEFGARMPSVAAGVATVGLTYLLALRVLKDTRLALWAAIILMTNLRFWWQARFGQIDMLLTACMTAGLYALWRFDEERDRRWLFLLYGAVAAGARTGWRACWRPWPWPRSGMCPRAWPWPEPSSRPRSKASPPTCSATPSDGWSTG